jgi:hypothetical protein
MKGEHESLSFRETYQLFRPCLRYGGIGENQRDNPGADQCIREATVCLDSSAALTASLLSLNAGSGAP